MPKYSRSIKNLWDSPSLKNLNKLIRLEEKLIEHAAKMKDRSQKTIEAMENDRKVLSKRIIDSIACTLAAIKMQLEDRIGSSDECPPPNTMSLEKIVTHLSEAINETRNISREMRAHSLSDFGLKPALIEYIQHFKQLYPGIEVVSQIETEGKDIAADIETVLFRVVQEALKNVVKHSEATKVSIKLTRNQNQLHLAIADNGSGFDLQKAMLDKEATGYGLHSMREHVEIFKGKFHLRSEPDAGATIEASIPL